MPSDMQRCPISEGKPIPSPSVHRVKLMPAALDHCRTFQGHRKVKHQYDMSPIHITTVFLYYLNKKIKLCVCCLKIIRLFIYLCVDCGSLSKYDMLRICKYAEKGNERLYLLRFNVYFA